MGVTLERVQFKFASIIGELCSEPDILSQFAVWVDLRLAEYKLKGSISLDCSGESPDPVWLKGIKSAILEKALSLRNASGGDLGRVGPVRSPKPHIASRSANSARDSRGPSTPSVEQRLSPVVIKEEPSDVFPVSIHRSKLDSRKRPISDTESGDRDVLNSMGSPSKQSRLEANPENESLMSIIGMDNADDETPEIAEVSQENIAREIDYLISQNAGEKAELETTQMSGDSSYASAFPSTSSQGANNNGRQQSSAGITLAKDRSSSRLQGLNNTSRCHVRRFEMWMSGAHRENRNVEHVPPKQLDAYLEEFCRTARARNGEEFSHWSLLRIRSSLERHLKDHGYPESIVRSPTFWRSNKALKEKMESLVSQKSSEVPQF